MKHSIEGLDGHLVESRDFDLLGGGVGELALVGDAHVGLLAGLARSSGL